MEKKDFKRTLVTAALPYANGGVHIGHLAGVYVPADIYVRYLRLRGRDVLFICGSDEHGVPITIRAKKEGVTPQDVCDRYHKLIKESFEKFGISFSIYSRTTSDVHAKTATEFFEKLYEKGEFIEQESEQYFDEEAKTFLADRYIKGECPHCGNPDAYGDQCEKCGKDLSPPNLSIRTAPSAVQNQYCAQQSIGTCRSTKPSPGWRSGYLLTTPIGVPTWWANVRVGLIWA